MLKILTTIELLLILINLKIENPYQCSELDYDIEQLDIITAFLKSVFRETVYQATTQICEIYGYQLCSGPSSINNALRS